jgi:DNA modification methylase
MLIQADARMLPLRDGCVDCVVTSPPYFGLRDYGLANQIGLEPTPDAYVAAMVMVFRELRRVLKDSGTVWLNLGDSYNGGGRAGSDKALNGKQGSNRGSLLMIGRPIDAPGLEAKQLLGIPWRVAFALQADGWYLRSDIIWSKPNPMPESVTDRPTKAHEYLFLLAKSERYFYDAAAIAELADVNRAGRLERTFSTSDARSTMRHDVGRAVLRTETRNKRSVWTVTTMPYAGAHFATMPEALVEPCILAGCPLGGLVLDPFIGSGTVGAVAERLGRRWVGVDLNPAYHRLAKKRTAQRGLRFEEVVA